MKCGSSQKEITPPIGSHLSGNQNIRISEGVADPLFVRAVAFEVDRYERRSSPYKAGVGEMMAESGKRWYTPSPTMPKNIRCSAVPLKVPLTTKIKKKP